MHACGGHRKLLAGLGTRFAPLSGGGIALGQVEGWGTGSSGSGFPIEVQINPDGTYTSMMDTGRGTGTFKVAGGKITSSGHLSGPNPTDTAAQVTLATKGGKQILTGQGRSDRGPYSFELTKE